MLRNFLVEKLQFRKLLHVGYWQIIAWNYPARAYADHFLIKLFLFEYLKNDVQE